MARVKIAVLDDYAGIAAEYFQAIPGVQIDAYPDTLDPAKSSDFQSLVERLRPYTIISSMRERTPFPAALLRELPNLKLLLTTAMRNLGIDMHAAAERGIIVTGAPASQPATKTRSNGEPRPLPPPTGHSATVQHAWALLLALCSRIPQDDQLLRSDHTAWQSGLAVTLPGKTLGIVGLGRLGIAFAKIGIQAWGMRVIAWSENLTQEKADAAAEKAGLEKGSFEVVSKPELLRQADVVSLHYVLSDRSRGMIGRSELDEMKRDAILLNSSRGPLIDEAALVDALKEKKIRGFATDVFWDEPLSRESIWRKADMWAPGRVVMSPHMGYVNEGTMHRWYEEQAEIVSTWITTGEVLHRLN